MRLSGTGDRLDPAGHVISEEKGTYLFMKQIIDYCGATIGIFLFLIPSLMIALCIKTENPKASILFKQKRVGKDGKPFDIYKFRSMIPDAEKRLPDLLAMNHPSCVLFKMKHDPRVTRVGRFIRKTSLDEIPQFINVLKGEMSLVGPRPPLLNEVEKYSRDEMKRLSVLPGCTGLWQVSGRSSLSFKEMLALDFLYIQRRSVFFDVILILKTIKVMIYSKDAY